MSICEINAVNSNRHYAMLITKSKKQWSGLYAERYFWTFEKTKSRRTDLPDNGKHYKKYIQFTFVDWRKPGPGPDIGTGGNTSGG